MKTIIKRQIDYTMDEYHSYCINNGLFYSPEVMSDWVNELQDDDIWEFVNSFPKKKKWTVEGLVELPSGVFTVKPVKLTLKEALRNMMTPDLYDLEIRLDKSKNIYTFYGYHAPKCVNIFTFKVK